LYIARNVCHSKYSLRRYAKGIRESQGEEGNQAKDDVTILVDTAARGIFNSVDEHGIEAVEDWEVNELLQWTHGLNFDRFSAFTFFLFFIFPKGIRPYQKTFFLNLRYRKKSNP